MTIKAVYDKINNPELNISRELVVDGFRHLSPVVDKLSGKQAPLLSGFRALILDGNHFAATQRRLKELRNKTAGPLSGTGTSKQRSREDGNHVPTAKMLAERNNKKRKY